MADPERQSNPLGQLFGSAAETFLGCHIGREVTPELVQQLGHHLLQVEFSLLVIQDIKERLNISQQRTSQLAIDGALPPAAAILRCGKRVWVASDIEHYCEARLISPPKPGRPKKQS